MLFTKNRSQAEASRQRLSGTLRFISWRLWKTRSGTVRSSSSQSGPNEPVSDSRIRNWFPSLRLAKTVTDESIPTKPIPGTWHQGMSESTERSSSSHEEKPPLVGPWNATHRDAIHRRRSLGTLFQTVKAKYSRDKLAGSEDAPEPTSIHIRPRRHPRKVTKDIISEPIIATPVSIPPRLDVLAELPKDGGLHRSSTFRACLEKAVDDINDKYGASSTCVPGNQDPGLGAKASQHIERVVTVRQRRLKHLSPRMKPRLQGINTDVSLATVEHTVKEDPADEPAEKEIQQSTEELSQGNSKEPIVAPAAEKSIEEPTDKLLEHSNGLESAADEEMTAPKSPPNGEMPMVESLGNEEPATNAIKSTDSISSQGGDVVHLSDPDDNPSPLALPDAISSTDLPSLSIENMMNESPPNYVADNLVSSGPVICCPMSNDDALVFELGHVKLPTGDENHIAAEARSIQDGATPSSLAVEQLDSDDSAISPLELSILERCTHTRNDLVQVREIDVSDSIRTSPNTDYHSRRREENTLIKESVSSSSIATVGRALRARIEHPVGRKPKRHCSLAAREVSERKASAGSCDTSILSVSELVNKFRRMESTSERSRVVESTRVQDRFTDTVKTSSRKTRRSNGSEEDSGILSNIEDSIIDSHVLIPVRGQTATMESADKVRQANWDRD